MALQSHCNRRKPPAWDVLKSSCSSMVWLCLYTNICYNWNLSWHSVCLVINPITVHNLVPRKGSYLSIYVGWGLSVFVCCLVHGSSTDDFLLRFNFHWCCLCHPTNLQESQHVVSDECSSLIHHRIEPWLIFYRDDSLASKSVIMQIEQLIVLNHCRYWGRGLRRKMFQLPPPENLLLIVLMRDLSCGSYWWQFWWSLQHLCLKIIFILVKLAEWPPFEKELLVLFVSYFGFDGRIWVLISKVSGHCSLHKHAYVIYCNISRL